jgi:hypothetical protein
LTARAARAILISRFWRGDFHDLMGRALRHRLRETMETI